MIEGSAAVQRLPPVLPPALDDAPWGSILIHQPDAAEALELQRILRIAGYRMVGPAASAADVARFLERNEVDCAVIDARGGFELGVEFDRRDIPLVVVSSDVAGAIMWRAAGRALVLRPYRAAEILRAIHHAMRGRTGRSDPRGRQLGA